MTAEELAPIILSIAIFIREMMLAVLAPKKTKKVLVDSETGVITFKKAMANESQVAEVIYMRNQIEKERAKNIWFLIAKALKSLPEDLAEILPGLRIKKVEGNIVHICRL